MPADVNPPTRPYVYGVLEGSGSATIGHLDGACKAIKGERHFIPRRLQPDADQDSWPCARCVSLDQLADWARRDGTARPKLGAGRTRGTSAAVVLPPEEISVPQEKSLYSGDRIADDTGTRPDGNPGPRTKDTTMNAPTINRTNDLTAEVLEGLKNAFATAARYGVPGVADMREATLKCYRLGDLTAQLALDLTDTYVAAAQVKAQVAADQASAPAPAVVPMVKGMIVTNAAGQIVRLYARKADGKLYGKVRDDYGYWEYVPGAMNGARHLTADEARQLGITTERCIFCATPIETKESLAAGYGPDCAEKYGLPWG